MDADTEDTGRPEPETAAGAGPVTPQVSTPAQQDKAGSANAPFGASLPEIVVFGCAILGAIALGLGITDYFSGHLNISVYLLVYGGYLLADQLMRGDGTTGAGLNEADPPQRLPLLLLFAAAPFERTYIYGGEPSASVAMIGLAIELAGLWLVLGARIQRQRRWLTEPGKLLTSGFYSRIRHPILAGTLMIQLAWPLEYSAPLTLIVALIAALFAASRRIRWDEAAMRGRFGKEYDAYQDRTDCLIPGIW